MKLFSNLSIALLFFVISGCATMLNSTIPGSSIADAKLKRDVLRNLSRYENACSLTTDAKRPGGDGDVTSFLKIVASSLVESPGPGNGGQWVEIWTVERWGPNADYRITFTPDGRGGTFLKISPPTEHLDELTNM